MFTAAAGTAFQPANHSEASRLSTSKTWLVVEDGSECVET